jgi:hypothetical protein
MNVRRFVRTCVGPFLWALLLAVGARNNAAQAANMVLNFDSVAATGGGTLYPGNIFAASSVTFTSGAIPNSVNVSDVITLSNLDNQLLLIGNTNSISPPNFAAASMVFGGAANDLLIAFATPVTSIQLTTDDASPDGGGADIVRLLALVSTGNPNEYQVLALAQGLDNATTSPANLLSVDLGGTPFSYAIFQATSEAEGFDDLTFNTVPEPFALTLGLIAGVCVLRRPKIGRWG